ncbi:MAG: PSD1 and planctomycete cytochrome C domain-containing protein [Verrucomicrobiota bacterium]
MSVGGSKQKIVVAAMTAALVLPAALFAAVDEEGDAFFKKEIAPLLVERCFECHSHRAGKAKGGLVLDSRSGWMTGGDSGAAIVPGDLEGSLLIEAVRYGNADIEMPPDGKLTASEIAALERWVEEGAHDPRRGSGAGGAAVEEGTEQMEAADLWSFQPLLEAEPPEVEDRRWAGDAVDAFIWAGLQKAGLPPAERAPDATLLRRLHLALTGLPPSAEAVAAYDGDLETVVDELLASADFGEKWGRHWLDLTAYADTMGVGRAIPALEAWRYRDYVIGAFNVDKPFPEFIREQVAGDIYEAGAPGKPRGVRPTAEAIVATGFLAIGPWELVSGDKVQLRMDVVDKQVHRIGQAFLGMTLGCARCHAHKFDPVSQEDYFALAGILKSTVTLNGRIDGVFSALNHSVLPETPEELSARAERVRAFEEELAEELRLEDEKKAETALLAKEIARLKGDEEGDDTVDEDESQEIAKLEAKRVKMEAGMKRHGTRRGLLEYVERHRTQPLALAVMDAPEPEDSRINIRGNAHQLGDVVPRGFLSEVAPKGKVAWTRGGSGRVQLAEWLASADNPLTARVWVNRVWHHLFGAGLVRTVDNFGARGEAPSHPELLDYLAAEFMRDGWSTKKLIRRLVMSEAWQQDSVNHDAMVAGVRDIDPENRLYWRSNRRRLEAEAIRDGMLFVSGQLDRKRGGPALPVDEPGNMRTNSTGIMSDTAVFPDDLKNRRTIYLPQKRKGAFIAADFMEAFDLPDTDQETGKRTLTSVPTQALYLVNAPFVQECGRALAVRYEAEAPAERLRAVYRTLFSREPEAGEVVLAMEYLAETKAGLQREWEGTKAAAGIEEEAWARLCQALLISNEFLFRS